MAVYRDQGVVYKIIFDFFFLWFCNTKMFSIKIKLKKKSFKNAVYLGQSVVYRIIFDFLFHNTKPRIFFIKKKIKKNNNKKKHFKVTVYLGRCVVYRICFFFPLPVFFSFFFFCLTSIAISLEFLCFIHCLCVA